VSTPFPPTPAGGSTGDVAADVALADQEQLDAENAAAAGAAPSALNSTDQATLNDDWAKVAAWDVTDAAGRPVNTLDGLADVLGTDRTTAAGMLLSSPMASAAPPRLTAEANAEVNPAAGTASLLSEFEDEIDTAPADPDGDELAGPDGTDLPEDDGDDEEGDDLGEQDPDGDVVTGDDEDQDEDEDDEDDDAPAFLKGKKKKSLAAGEFVTLPDGRRGRVELVVSNGGTVPGVDAALVGTKSDPAARVRVYRQAGGRLLPTGLRTAVKSAQLQRKATPRPAPAGDVSARLVLKVAQHAGPAGSGKPTADAIRTVYARGRGAWPGEAKTLLSADEWALGRVDAFLQKAAGHDIEHYVGDDDLLP